MNPDGLHIAVGDASVTLTSTLPGPIAWARRWFGPWWGVSDSGRREGRFALHVDAETSQGCCAVGSCACDGERRATLVGPDDDATARQAAHLVQAAILDQLHRDQWSLIDASAVTRDGRALLALGEPGTAKISVALQLAAARWAVVGVEGVLARAQSVGVALLPWPSALPGDALPGQAPGDDVLASDLAAAGSLLVAPYAYAHALVHPKLDPSGPPAILDDPAAPLQGEQLYGGHADVDQWRLPRRRPRPPCAARDALTDRLADLPQLVVRLGPDATANGQLLTVAGAAAVGL